MTKLSPFQPCLSGNVGNQGEKFQVQLYKIMRVDDDAKGQFFADIKVRSVYAKKVKFFLSKSYEITIF